MTDHPAIDCGLTTAALMAETRSFKQEPLTALKIEQLTQQPRELIYVDCGRIGLPVALLYYPCTRHYEIHVAGEVFTTTYDASIVARLFNQHAGLD